MDELPQEAFRKWGHSFEEDAEGVTCYRHAEYAFPRARGRAGIEFRPDGEFIDWTIGRGDAQRGVAGQWQMEGPGRVRVSFEGAAGSPRVYEIVRCDGEVLALRRQPASP